VASAHGLGHLLPPYDEKSAPANIPSPPVKLSNLGVQRWQCDVWYRILEGALTSTDQVSLSELPGFDHPAVTRYSATTPSLLRWCGCYNKERRLYVNKVKPFNFLLMFQTSTAAWRSHLTDDVDGFEDLPRAIAPYDKDPIKAAQHCFDRDTGKPVPASLLKTYAQALAQYHLHPESKFQNADWTDRGETKRWHVRAEFIEYIGKEANRWEEQLFVGADPEAQVYYSVEPSDTESVIQMIETAVKTYSVETLGRIAHVSRQSVHALLNRETSGARTLMRLARGVPIAERQHRERIEHETAVLEAVSARCAIEGTRPFARRAGIDHSNLLAVLDGRRAVSAAMLAKLEAACDGGPAAATESGT